MREGDTPAPGSVPVPGICVVARRGRRCRARTRGGRQDVPLQRAAPRQLPERPSSKLPAAQSPQPWARG